MLLSLNPYKISINPALLDSTIEEFLAKADKPDELAAHLGWDPATDILVQGFAPLKDSKRLSAFAQAQLTRRSLKAKRQAKGFPDFIAPRKGLAGWMQKTFSDSKELKLSTAHDALAWLKLSPRYHLLVSLHDALISYISTSEPRRIEIKESSGFMNPVLMALYKNDKTDLIQIQKALSEPLKKVSPETLVNCFSGYVLNYDKKKSTAYYLS